MPCAAFNVGSWSEFSQRSKNHVHAHLHAHHTSELKISISRVQTHHACLLETPNWFHSDCQCSTCYLCVLRTDAQTKLEPTLYTLRKFIPLSPLGHIFTIVVKLCNNFFSTRLTNSSETVRLNSVNQWAMDDGGRPWAQHARSRVKGCQGMKNCANLFTCVCCYSTNYHRSYKTTLRNFPLIYKIHVKWVV